MAAGEDSLIEYARAVTKALEEREFKKAEKLIRYSGNPRRLNADAHGPLTHLTLVLSGIAGYFNLRLASLLVQYGADLNPENVQTSPLELVIKLYLDVKALCDKHETSYSELAIGFHGEINPPPLRLKQQLSILMDMLMVSGADPYLATHDTLRQSTFHKVVAVENPDFDLLMKLYRRGCKFDKGDLFGTTPLMDHITIASRDRCFPLIDKVLCKAILLDLNHTNSFKESMLSRAMSTGSPITAMRLLWNGADPTLDVFVSDKRHSPIFEPLLRSSALYSSLSISSFSVPALNKVMMCSMFPVVDCTDICDFVNKILNDVLSKTEFPMSCLTNWEYCTRDVALLMLGRFKAGLQQMCVRRIMEYLIVKRHCLWNVIIGTITMEAYSRYAQCRIEEKDCEQWYLVTLLSPRVIANLRRELGLPARIEPRFLIEAARLQLAAYFFDTLRWNREHCIRFLCGYETDFKPIFFPTEQSDDFLEQKFDC